MTEFSMTLSSGVVLSSLMALTLVPVMQQRLGRTVSQPQIVQKNHEFDCPRFTRSLEWTLAHPKTALLAALLLALAGYSVSTQVAREYAPKEDRGVFFLNVKGQEGATYEYMEGKIEEIQKKLAPIVERGDVKRFLVRLPRSFSNSESFNNGFIIFVLNDWAERPPIGKLIEEAKQLTKGIQGVKIIPIQRRSLGPRTAKPVELAISGPSWAVLKDWREKLDAAIAKDNPGLTSMDWDLVENRPQWALNIDYEKASLLNLELESLAQDLSILWGSQLTSRLQTPEKEYDVWMEIRPNEITEPWALESFRVKNTQGTWISLNQFAKWEESATSPSLAHYNRQRAISFDANLSEDLALADALSYLEKTIRATLPDTAQIYYKGQSRDFFSASESGLLVFVLALLIAYLALAAQFESWRHPFSLFVPLPLSFVGAFLFMWIGQISLNVYSQIALVLLIALMAKNGILIVEFANQLRAQGREIKEAIMESAQIRLRPILMTNLTTIAGIIPLVLAFGAGAESRQAIGWTVLGGMLMSLFISLYLVPLTYYSLENKRLKGKKHVK
jgi:multidrug efflux pump